MRDTESLHMCHVSPLSSYFLNFSFKILGVHYSTKSLQSMRFRFPLEGENDTQTDIATYRLIGQNSENLTNLDFPASQHRFVHKSFLGSF